MNWRTTACVLVLALASVVWSSWSRPLDLLPSPELNLDAYSQIEVLGDTGWSMSKKGDWRTTRPSRARLSNTRVEQWIRHFDRLESCPPPEETPAHTIRFSESDSSGPLDVPVWFDVVGPAKIQLDGRWYSVSSEVVEPIRFGLAPFRTLQVVPPSFSPTAVRITLGDRVSLELLRTSSWSIREPLEAPADSGAVQAWLEAVESKAAAAILGEVPATQSQLLSGLFPVAAELTLVGTELMPTRSIRFGKRLADGSRLAQIRGEDVVFVVGPEDTAFMLPSPTRFLFPTCSTLLPERIHTIAVGQQRNRFPIPVKRLDLLGTILVGKGKNHIGTIRCIADVSDSRKSTAGIVTDTFSSPPVFQHNFEMQVAIISQVGIHAIIFGKGRHQLRGTCRTMKANRFGFSIDRKPDLHQAELVEFFQRGIDDGLAGIDENRVMFQVAIKRQPLFRSNVFLFCGHVV